MEKYILTLDICMGDRSGYKEHAEPQSILCLIEELDKVMLKPAGFYHRLVRENSDKKRCCIELHFHAFIEYLIEADNTYCVNVQARKIMNDTIQPCILAISKKLKIQAEGYGSICITDYNIKLQNK